MSCADVCLHKKVEGECNNYEAYVEGDGQVTLHLLDEAGNKKASIGVPYSELIRLMDWAQAVMKAHADLEAA